MYLANSHPAAKAKNFTSQPLSQFELQSALLPERLANIIKRLISTHPTRATRAPNGGDRK